MSKRSTTDSPESGAAEQALEEAKVQAAADILGVNKLSLLYFMNDPFSEVKMADDDEVEKVDDYEDLLDEAIGLSDMADKYILERLKEEDAKKLEQAFVALPQLHGAMLNAIALSYADCRVDADYTEDEMRVLAEKMKSDEELKKRIDFYRGLMGATVTQVVLGHQKKKRQQ